MRLLTLVPVSIFFMVTALFASAPEGFSYLGDKPTIETEIPEGWTELDFSPPQLEGELLYQKDGISIFGHHYQGPVLQKTPFKIKGRKSTISLSAALGEYEPCVFTIISERELGDLQVTVSNLEKIGGRGYISQDNCEVRYVDFRPRNNEIPFELKLTHQLWVGRPSNKKYLWIPHILVKEEKTKLKQNENKTFWLTFFIPKETTPGIYRGKITLRGGDKKITLPVKMQVLPFSLVSKPITFGMYYVIKDYSSVPLLRDKEFQDMNERGFSSLFCYPLPKGEALEAFFKQMIETGLNHSFIYSGNLIKREPLKVDASGFKLICSATDESEFKGRKVIIKSLDKLKQSKDSGAINYATVVGPCVGLTGGALWYPYLDIECYNIMRPEFSKAAHRRGTQYWYYANGCFATIARLYWGLLGWALDADGIDAWAYRSPSPEESYKELFARYPRLYTYPSPNGPIPTISWECVREGIDDFSYLATLENLIYAQKHTLNADLAVALKEAQEFIRTLRANVCNIEIVYGSLPFYCSYMSSDDYEYYENARRLTASHILKIALLRNGNKRAKEVRIPKLKKTKVQKGRECLRDKSFTTLNWKESPWQVKKDEGAKVSYAALPQNAGKGLKVQFSGEKEAKVTLTQDLSSRFKELAGQNIMVSMQIFSPSDLLGLHATLHQKNKAGKRLVKIIGFTDYGGMHSCTAIPEPGEWVTRQVGGKVSPNADKISISFSVRYLGIRPEEKNGVIYIKDVSLRPLEVDKIEMRAPQVNLEQFAALTDKALVLPQGKGLPYPKNNPLPAILPKK